MHQATPYRVVGILAPTGSVVDRLVLTGIDSVWQVHDAHRRGRTAAAAEATQPNGHDDDAEEREVTIALIKYASPLAAASLPRAINARTSLQAASPAYETARLLSVFGVGTDIIRGFALLLIGPRRSACSSR